MDAAMRVSKLSAFFCVTALLAQSTTGKTADIYAIDTDIFIVGEITLGDTVKFLDALDGARKMPDAPLITLTLSSSGGSLGEAMAIGHIVREGLIQTDVASNRLDLDPSVNCDGGMMQEDCICASACFLIWAAGVPRLKGNFRVHEPRAQYGYTDLSQLAVHRPHFNNKEFADLPIEEARNAYEALTEEVSNYLSEMEVPVSIKELMFSISSGEIRLLTKDEEALIGEFSPSISEWFKAKCGEFTQQEEDDTKNAEIAINDFFISVSLKNPEIESINIFRFNNAR